jgi:hypothetical protein
MMVNFGDFFYQLEDWGFFDWVLPFLLVFVIIFAVLEKTMILGKDKETNKPRTNLNTILALIFGLIVVMQTQIVTIINTYLSRMALFFIIALIGLLAIGLFQTKKEDGTDEEGFLTQNKY